MLTEEETLILLRNLSRIRGLCSGLRLRVKKLRDRIIRCTVLNGNFKGIDVFLPRIPLTSTDERHMFFTRLQFPIKLAFAMTKNRAQGQLFRRVGLHLKYDVFSHGQLCWNEPCDRSQ